MTAHQKWLWDCKTEFLATLPAETVLHIEYSTLLGQPNQVVSHIVQFLNLSPSVQQILKAISYVDPNRRHVFSTTGNESARLAA